MPVISVVIPFYNQLSWLKEAVESVINQTYPDFEILLVNDGSTDDVSIISPLLKSKKISYFYQSNRGPSAARNIGIQNSKGQYIAFLDSDDIFLLEKLFLQLKMFEEQPDAVLCHTSYQRIDEKGQPLEIIHSGLFTGAVYPFIYDGCPIAASTVMVRKKVFENCNVFNESIRIGEDILLWAEIANTGLVYGIDVPLTSVRMWGKNAATDHETQIIGDKNIIKYGILKAPHISWSRRRRFLSVKYQNLAYHYYHTHKIMETIHSLAYSFWYDPIFAISKLFSTVWGKSKR
jgi:glycosyltransferase involved in cell wall biosynthesis